MTAHYNRNDIRQYLFNNNYILNGVFSNGSFKELLINGSATFLGMTFALTLTFFLQPLTFAHTDCPSHRLLIPIQRSKNENLKIEISRITKLFSSVFIYKKIDERDRER
jgi:hypothetical protein